MSTIDTSSVIASTTSTSSSSSTSSEAIGEEFNSFIKLLTAQVRNQDPLAPMDSTQFVDQLATFSTLEQQVRSNDSLEGIASLIGELHSMFASEWIGESVAVSSDWVPYSGSEIEFEINVPEEVDATVFNVLDSDGAIVWSETLDLDDDRYSWSGQTLAGEYAQTDTLFQFQIEAYRGSEYLGTITPEIITTITDVANEDGTLRFGTAAHLSTDLDSVRKLAS